MKFAFIAYDGMTLLDFAGAYDPVTRLATMGFLPDLVYDVCSTNPAAVSFEGLQVLCSQPDSLVEYDYIFIPGGNGVGRLIGDPSFLRWIKSVRSDAVMTAVCGGSLVLGAAGFLQGKRAATHPALTAYLAKFTPQVSGERVVEDGRVITARGVTSAIDLGLYLCEKIAGREAREKIQAQMDYAGYPY